MLIKNVDPDKYWIILGSVLDSKHNYFFLIWNFDFGKNFIFGVDNSSSTHADNRRKDILVLGEGRTLGLDNSAITARAKYFSNFTPSQNKFC